MGDELNSSVLIGLVKWVLVLLFIFCVVGNAIINNNEESVQDEKLRVCRELGFDVYDYKIDDCSNYSFSQRVLIDRVGD